jgi:Tfp pilus assembly protein PilO
MQGPKIVLIAILLAALPATAWFWMFKPSGEEIERVSAENRVKKQRIQEAERALSDSDAVNKTNKLKEALELFKQRLPDQSEVSSVMNEVAKIATKHKLDARNFQKVSDAVKEGYGEQTVRWILVGTFKPNLTEFFEDLEALPRITRISEMRIDSDDKHTGVVTATFLMTTYYTPKENGSDKKVAVSK